MIDNILKRLSQSKFRGSFHLKSKEFNYINKLGLEKINSHAYDFIRKRLSPKNILNDGKQTPTHNPPVFIAQHATATCCRGCLYKWHHIEKNKQLIEEISYIVAIIMKWIKNEINYK